MKTKSCIPAWYEVGVDRKLSIESMNNFTSVDLATDLDCSPQRDSVSSKQPAALLGAAAYFATGSELLRLSIIVMVADPTRLRLVLCLQFVV